MNRRCFLQQTLSTAAVLTAAVRAQPSNSPAAPPAPSAAEAPALIDTNIHLFDWPFRRLKYSRTADLVAKLRHHRIREAWAGSFEALLTKDVSGVNARLAEECRGHPGFLIPIGTVNPAWPDWEEDLRRCHEVHRMPGIRLYPRYHGLAVNDPEMIRLVRLATERGLLVQIALELEDPRVHHPVLQLPPLDVGTIAHGLKAVPAARVQLLDCTFSFQLPLVQPLLDLANVTFDFSSFESVGILDRLLNEKAGGRGTPIAPERLLFGSHAPYFPVEAALLRLFESPLTRRQLDPLMAGNARRLLSVVSTAP